MARYGAPLVTDVIRGKLGGVVFAKARSGPTIRVRVRPANPNTTRQSNVRAALTNAARAFKGLSSAHSTAWNTAAVGLSWPNGLGGSFTPSGINYYVRLASVFLAIAPAGTPPTTPPASPFAGTDIGITGAGGVGKVTFTSSAANGADIYTEVLYQPLPSTSRQPRQNAYKVAAYHHYAAAAGFDVTLAPGYYSLAYRFVLSTTGERGPLNVLGTFQVT